MDANPPRAGCWFANDAIGAKAKRVVIERDRSILFRVSDAGQRVSWRVHLAGVRKPSRNEPAVGGIRRFGARLPISHLSQLFTATSISSMKMRHGGSLLGGRHFTVRKAVRLYRATSNEGYTTCRRA